MNSPLQAQLRRRAVSLDSLTGLGISASRAQELLDGADPTISEIRKIGAALRIPIRSLVTNRPFVAEGKFKLRENFQSELDVDYEIFDLLARAEALAGAISHKEQLRVSFALEPTQKSFEVAETLAAACRREFLKADGLAPLIDLETRIAAFTSAHVLISAQRKLEGGVVAHQHHSFIFLSPRPDPRMRFTLAHELCHYLVDLPYQESGAWFDEDVFDSSSISNRTDEWFANSFASALLLPPNGVGETLGAFREHHKLRDEPASDYEIMFLAIFFGVSFQVAARRLEDLKILPRGATQSLYENIRSRFGTPEKLAEALALPRRETHEWGGGSRLLLSEVRDAVASGKISIGRLAEIIEMPIEEVSRIIAR